MRFAAPSLDLTCFSGAGISCTDEAGTVVTLKQCVLQLHRHQREADAARCFLEEQNWTYLKVCQQEPTAIFKMAPQQSAGCNHRLFPRNTLSRGLGGRCTLLWLWFIAAGRSFIPQRWHQCTARLRM